jgi:Lon protease-like protein
MEVPSTVPVMILQNAILFPQALVPLYIFEPRYRRMLTDVLEGDRVFAIARRKPDVQQERAEKVAGLGLVRACVTHPDGTSHLVIVGLSRVELLQTVRYKPYRVCRIQPWQPTEEKDEIVQALAVELMEVVHERLKEFPNGLVAELSQLGMSSDDTQKTAAEVFQNLLDHLHAINDPEQVVDLVSAALLADPTQRQIILATRPLETRMRYLLRFLLTPQGTFDDFNGDES